MNLKLKSVADKGSIDKERLVIRVVNDTNVGEFAIFRTGFYDNEVTVGVVNTFWFPDKQVRAGDLVVLYSKAGATSEKKLESGNTAHFYYWGQSEPLWSNSQRAAVLLHAPAWESSKAEDL
jgi:hypothetical protein